MGTLYAGVDGSILRGLFTAAEEAAYGAPSGTTQILTFDSSTNVALVQDMRGVPGVQSPALHRYTVVSGALQKDGQAVTVNAPDPDLVRPSQAIIQALRARTATDGQQQAVILFLLRQVVG